MAQTSVILKLSVVRRKWLASSTIDYEPMKIADQLRVESHRVPLIVRSDTTGSVEKWYVCGGPEIAKVRDLQRP